MFLCTPLSVTPCGSIPEPAGERAFILSPTNLFVDSDPYVPSTIKYVSVLAADFGFHLCSAPLMVQTYRATTFFVRPFIAPLFESDKYIQELFSFFCEPVL